MDLIRDHPERCVIKKGNLYHTFDAIDTNSAHFYYSSMDPSGNVVVSRFTVTNSDGT